MFSPPRFSPVQFFEFVVVLLVVMLGFAQDARALPSFARQTGLECTSCHVSWPELTPLGRRFKIGGYTLKRPVEGPAPWVSFDASGPPPKIPLAAFIQAGITHVNDADPAASSQFPRQDELAIGQASLFYGGKITDEIGAFVQATYDGIGHNTQIDNTDVRAASSFEVGSNDLVLGASLNNNPSLSDPYNTTPAWRFPFVSSPVAPTPIATPEIDGGLAQQVAGITAYALYADTLYLEGGAYHTARGLLQPLRAGVDAASAARLSANAPYWRIALQHNFDEGRYSAMVGAFGLDAGVYPLPDSFDPTGQSDRFLDRGVDTQFQFLGERDRLSAQVALIAERQSRAASAALGLAEFQRLSLDELSAKISYYRDTRYGFSLGWLAIEGSRDPLLYAAGPVTGSRLGRPDSRAVTAEWDWLYERDRRFFVQFVDYLKFNGATSDYDGSGRTAHANNTLFAGLWFAF